MTASPKNKSTIPLPLFFGKAQKDQVRISPCGTWLGWRERDKDEGVLNLWVQSRLSSSSSSSTNSYDSKPRQITFETDRDVCLLYWFSCDDETLIYLREPKNGSELYHLHALDLHDISPDGGPTVRDLFQNDNNITCAVGFAGGLQFWLDPDHPRYIYTSTANCGIRSLFWNISRIHLDSCQRDIVQYNPLSTWPGLIWFALCSIASFLLQCLGIHTFHPRATVQWFPDQNMNFRGRLEISLQNLSCAWRVQESSSSSTTTSVWKLLHSVEWKDTNMSLVGSSGGSGTAHFDFPFNGTKDGDEQSTILVDLHLCNMGDTTSFERFNVATGKHQETLASHNKSDITGFILHPKTKQVQAVTYNYEKPEFACFEDCPQDVKEDLDYLHQQFTGASFSIVNRTLDDTIWAIFVQSDSGIALCEGCPSGYFLFHRTQSSVSDATSNATTNKPPSRHLELAATPQPEFSKYSSFLGSMKPVQIPARDGENLLCYLSTPSAASSLSKGSTPLVLLIHGGPQARDVWQFHPWCQLLCNRGMSVLQVNYRGSTGMGGRFVKIGMNGIFATRLQEDIQDAAQFAIQQKWCPADRIAIMGGSFGGYCSLAAMTFLADSDKNPDYQCAVAICPPTIFGAANPHKAFYGNPLVARYWKQVFGPEISGDVKASQAVSPLFHMQKVKKPILILHGEDDPRVPIEQSNKAVQKLKAAGCEYIRFRKEGHGIRKEQNVLYMAHRIERFLCQHLQLPEPPVLEETWTLGHTATPMPLGLGMGDFKDKKI